jgi:hypothetical protein
MADCEFLKGCIFFNDKMATKPATAELFKTIYCRGDFARCARYLVVKAIGREQVPKDLYPNDAERAEKIIAEAKAASKSR